MRRARHRACRGLVPVALRSTDGVVRGVTPSPPRRCWGRPRWSGSRARHPPSTRASQSGRPQALGRRGTSRRCVRSAPAAGRCCTQRAGAGHRAAGGRPKPYVGPLVGRLLVLPRVRALEEECRRRTVPRREGAVSRVALALALERLPRRRVSDRCGPAAKSTLVLARCAAPSCSRRRPCSGAMARRGWLGVVGAACVRRVEFSTALERVPWRLVLARCDCSRGGRASSRRETASAHGTSGQQSSCR